MAAEGRAWVTPRPRECEGVDAATGGRRLRLKKCKNVAKWRIRIRGREYVACDKHRNKGILLGPVATG